MNRMRSDQGETVRITLRLPKELHEALVNSATAERRSLNGEIVYRLEQTMTPIRPPRPATPAPGADS